MRTKFTLDGDVARLVKDEAKRSGDSFRGTANHLLRLGLTAAQKPQKKKFVVTPRAMGLRPGLSYDSISELLEKIEGPYHR